MDWTNFNSGLTGSLIGALVGFFAAIYSQRWGLREQVKAELISKLFRMKSFHFAEVTYTRELKSLDDVKDPDPIGFYIDSFPEVYACFHRYRNLFCCRGGLDEGWRKYRGISENAGKFLSETYAPIAKPEEVESRVKGLLDAL
jgi:hypothetical protein